MFNATHNALARPLNALVIATALFAIAPDAFAVQPHWRKLTVVGAKPPQRRHAVVVYDAAQNRVIMFGGDKQGSPESVYNDVWALNLGNGSDYATWQQLWSDDGSVACTPFATTPRPCRRHGHSGAYFGAPNGGTGKLMIHGGRNAAGTILDDTWQLWLGATSTTWERVCESIPGAPDRYHGSAINHYGWFNIFGGVDHQGSAYNDMWAINSNGGTEYVFGSGSESPSGDHRPYPIRRYYHTQILDTRFGRVSVYGGVYLDEGQSDFKWTTDAINWVPPWQDSPQPVSRFHHHAFYDSLRARMIVSGGYTPFGLMQSTTHALNFPTDWLSPYPGPEENWEQLSPTGTGPGPHAEGGIAYDRVKDRMFLIGGLREGGAYTDDVFVLEFTDMTEPEQIDDIAVANSTVNSVTLQWTAPGDDGSTGTASRYDMRRSTSSIDDDEEFDAATPVSGVPAPLSAGTPQSVFVGGLSQNTKYYFRIRAWDDAQHATLSKQMCVRLQGTSTQDCSQEGFSAAPVSGGSSSPSAFGLRRVTPNPSRGELDVSLGLASAGEATLELLDVAGRLVERLELGDLAAGERSVRFDRLRTIPSGRYVLRLRQGADVAAQDVVITR